MMSKERRKKTDKKDDFSLEDIIAVQKYGDDEAWRRIRNHFKSYIYYLAYQPAPYRTREDCLDREAAAESALMRAVMMFDTETIKGGKSDETGHPSFA